MVVMITLIISPDILHCCLRRASYTQFSCIFQGLYFPLTKTTLMINNGAYTHAHTQSRDTAQGLREEKQRDCSPIHLRV